MSEYIAAIAGRCTAATTVVLLLTQPAVLRAQPDLVVSARIQVPAHQLAFADSGKVALVLRIDGLSEDQRRALKANEIAIVGANGMRFVPSVVILTPNEAPRRSLLAEYTDIARGRVEVPQYLFLVPRGATAFELRLPFRDPVAFTAAMSLSRK